MFKNVSHRLKLFYKLSDHYKKNKNGVLSQLNKFDVDKKLSSNAQSLLKKINNNQPRYTKIDKFIEKYLKSG